MKRNIWQCLEKHQNQSGE